MVSVRTMRDEPVASNRKRERVDSTASIDSFSSVREVKPIASSNGKRQRLHSNTSGSAEKGGASAAALAARAAVAASRAQELHKKAESEAEEEEEVLRMLSPPNTHNADIKKSTVGEIQALYEYILTIAYSTRLSTSFAIPASRAHFFAKSRHAH
jgi:hypothetical protein